MTIVYFATAKLGLMMDAVSGFATLVWPPTGISLAALLLFGLRAGPVGCDCISGCTGQCTVFGDLASGIRIDCNTCASGQCA